jgi:small conductance mechanosensitive channel
VTFATGAIAGRAVGQNAQDRSSLSQIVGSWEEPADGRAALTGAIAPLTDFSIWARGNLLVIVLLVLGAILLTRLAEWARGRIVHRIDARFALAEELVRSEAAKHRHVVAQVLTWSILAVIYIVTAVLVVQFLGVPLAGLVAPAALISAGLGFGLQRFVQDIGAGFFITGERQYGFGDVVRISATGVSEPAVGTVEDVTLRVTRIRSMSGEVIITPNGQISQVTNLSRDWARAVIDVPVPSSVDVGRATEVLQGVGREVYINERLRKMMLDEPTVMGVERMEVDTFSVRMVARTLPGMQFDVGREIRARIASAFRSEGIMVSAELDTGHATGSDS